MFSPDPGNVFQVVRSRKHQTSAVNKHHTPTAPSFVLV
jgi:hypothetical protein